jgi:hypothetical protein
MGSKADWKLARADDVDPVALDIMDELIAAYHIPLAAYNIALLFKPKAWKSKGKMGIGKAHICGAQEKLLSGVHATITVALAWWDEFATPEQQVALLDHELSHFTVDTSNEDAPELQIVGHDVEEFVAIWRRHGAWTAGLEKAEEQLRLPFDDAEGDDLQITATSPGNRPVETTLPHILEAGRRIRAGATT